jgi:hypothetical protein
MYVFKMNRYEIPHLQICFLLFHKQEFLQRICRLNVNIKIQSFPHTKHAASPLPRSSRYCLRECLLSIFRTVRNTWIRSVGRVQNFTKWKAVERIRETVL